MTLPAIDWNAPWLADWRALGEPLAQAVAAGQPVADALNSARAAPVRFVPHTALPAGMAYEQFIFDTAQVPTRNNLHDFFGGLVWLRFAQAKQRLNALQAAEIARDGIGARRGPVRDAITTFDENGALLDAPEPLWQALRARQWQRLFVDLRPLWRQARLTLFGHALMEQLVNPRKPLTAHVYQAQAAIKTGASHDAALAADLHPDHLRAKPFTPLPVLGVPGWWPPNEDALFYADTQVFRPARG